MTATAAMMLTQVKPDCRFCALIYLEASRLSYLIIALSLPVCGIALVRYDLAVAQHDDAVALFGYFLIMCDNDDSLL